MFRKDIQYVKFCTYGFLKNLRFFEPFLILYLVESNISFLQIGFLFTIRAVAVNIMEIPSGVVADFIGRRRAMIFSFLSYIISFLLFFFIPEYYVIIIAMIFFAFGDAFRTGTHKAMILDYLKHKGWEQYRTFYYGNTRGWSQRGSAVSALIAAGLVFFTGNYRSVFLFTLIPYLAELVLMLSYPAWLDGKRNDKSDTDNKKLSISDIFIELGSGLKNKYIRTSFLNSSIPTGFFEAVKDYIQPLIAVLSLGLPVLTTIADKQRTALLSGIIYSIIFLLTSIASSSSGKLSGKFSSDRNFLNLSYVAGMLILAASGVSRWAGLNLVSIMIFMFYYLVQNLRRPVTVGFLSDQFNNDIMATALSTDSQLKTLWVAILSPAIGFMIDKWGLGAALAITGTAGLIVYPLIKLKSADPGKL